MRKIINFSESDSVLIILFQLYGSKAGSFWRVSIAVGSAVIPEEELIQY